MAKIVTIANEKGGVGKTTTSINLAAGVAVAEFPTLLIDMDPQANSTSGLGIDPRSLGKNIYEVLINGVEPSEAVVRTEMPFLSVLPSTINLVGAEVELVDVERREYVLAGIVEKVRNDYEYIFIDCPPSLGLLTLNGLVATDTVLIPVQCEYYALEGLGQLLNTVNIVQKNLNPRLEIGQDPGPRRRRLLPAAPARCARGSRSRIRGFDAKEQGPGRPLRQGDDQGAKAGEAVRGDRDLVRGVPVRSRFVADRAASDLQSRGARLPGAGRRRTTNDTS